MPASAGFSGVNPAGPHTAQAALFESKNKTDGAVRSSERVLAEGDAAFSPPFLSRLAACYYSWSFGLSIWCWLVALLILVKAPYLISLPFGL